MRIYDASAFFERLLRKDASLENFILDLTLYETGNISIKHILHLKDMSYEEAKSVLNIISMWTNVLTINGEDMTEIFSFANSLKLTFYDAAYIHFAKKHNATLETADDTLYKKTKGIITCEFLKQ